jgi:hypothetical protein
MNEMIYDRRSGLFSTAVLRRALRSVDNAVTRTFQPIQKSLFAAPWTTPARAPANRSSSRPRTA